MHLISINSSFASFPGFGDFGWTHWSFCSAQVASFPGFGDFGWTRWSSCCAQVFIGGRRWLIIAMYISYATKFHNLFCYINLIHRKSRLTEFFVMKIRFFVAIKGYFFSKVSKSLKCITPNLSIQWVKRQHFCAPSCAKSQAKQFAHILITSSLLLKLN